MKFKRNTCIDILTTLDKEKIINFLHEHLDEFGDSKEDISKAMDYALTSAPMAGGFILQAIENDEIKGVVVMNQTGMEGYIPENILVYIAVHRDERGKGLGKKLMKESMFYTKGDISLHVEPNNPAKYLYKKVGFETPYLEMRLKRKSFKLD